MGLAKVSHDREQTEYERFLTGMGSAHGLAILNGIWRFPESSGFTCFPHCHGASTVDYVMTTPSFVPCIDDSAVAQIGVVVDHAILQFLLSFSYSIVAPS
ncbi:hypothetical protein GOP47_0005820 [Adiantum capillus-veneris]|uniref:Uncharacterized protein n=1 Tax=Adiantum capillus-veneris TaxID=13818 RepID=A0A9D4V5S4_ADICA|nr:hypothetical protein GOP47_0005820 [Adiantum capillus-veneris]